MAYGMNKSIFLGLTFSFLLSALVLANSINDSVLNESPMNVIVGKDFTITLESNPGSTGFDWKTNFDTNYLTLVNSTFIPRNTVLGMVGVSGMKTFTFNAKRVGSTEVNMLLLRPWENGTIARSKLFKINIVQLTTKRPIFDIQQYSHVKPPYYNVPLTTSR
jgi:predicted secreted protein